MAEISEKNLEQENESTNFIFPQESSETKKAISDAENKINTSVKIFANALDTISPWLTNELLNIFDINKKNPAFKWLSESDLWLQSLWLLYERNVDKIPDKLENILNKMLELLTKYKSVRQRKILKTGYCWGEFSYISQKKSNFRHYIVNFDKN